MRPGPRPAPPSPLQAVMAFGWREPRTFDLDDAQFGGWKKAQATHFADGAFFECSFS